MITLVDSIHNIKEEAEDRKAIEDHVDTISIEFETRKKVSSGINKTNEMAQPQQKKES